MIDLIAKLAGLKTYVAAAGLVGLAVYQVSVGEFTDAAQSLLGAAAAAGLRVAVARAAAPPAP